MLPRIEGQGSETQTVEPSAHTSEERLAAALVRLHASVLHGEIETARLLLRDMEQEWSESPEVAYWARVLAPPTTRRVTEPDPRHRPLDRDTAWLREHARDYPGRWLAVFEDQLIAADPDLKKVLEIARRHPDGERALLHFEPGILKPQ